MASETWVQPAEFHPSALATTSPSTRTNTKAGSVSSPAAFTNDLSGSVKIKNRSVRGPMKRRVSAALAVTTKLMRASDPRKPSRMRTAVLSTHELSLV
jgi:hypothetical protein